MIARPTAIDLVVQKQRLLRQPMTPRRGRPIDQLVALALLRRQGDGRRDQGRLLAFEALTTGFGAPELEARHGQASKDQQGDQQQAHGATFEQGN
jgi:hypothetical protein